MIMKMYKCGTDYYQQELSLRDRILRKPLGMNLYDEDLSQDEKDIHIGAFIGEKLVGCILISLYKKTLKMRQVAVDDTYQGQGIGSEMVRYSEKYANENGYNKITMHARKKSVSFYKKLSYSTVGDEFTEVGVPHYKMEKILVVRK